MKNKHYYRDMTPEQKEDLFAYYLLDSWSFSKVATFARNEKAFEMAYIYRQPYKNSASNVAGSAYHDALRYYFLEFKKGNQIDLASAQMVAYNYIDDVKANDWKIQKTTPTIEECKIKSNEIVTKLLNNFFGEISTYIDEIAEIIDVEFYCDEFIAVNGVDIPLPCHSVIDMAFTSKAGKVIILDHKSKSTYTDDKEIKFSIGKQAITYVNVFEEATGITVDEVWFVENKYSQNKDKSQQIVPHKVEITPDVRRLYEAMLYEPLKKMLEAISNPDYIYIINENDNFVDQAEIYEFWCQTMIAEISDFNIPENKKELISQRLKKIRDTSLSVIDPKIIKKFRENAAEFIQYDLTNKNMTKEEKIEHTLRTLGVIVKVAHTFAGYSSDTFLVEVSTGVNISSVYKYKLDIAAALNVASIRMAKDLYVFDKRSYLAIEAAKPREMDLLFDPTLIEGDKIPLGIDNYKQKIIWDVNNPSTPHMLVCGSTGSGKSVFIISVIEYAKLAGFDNMVIFDPKYEFNAFKSDKIATFNEITEIEKVMEELVVVMNKRIESGTVKKTLVIFDEFADAVAMSRKGKQLMTGEKCLEENLRLLLQKGRSSGFRIIAATQRASVKVINGDAKVNFPVQICFKVPKEIDSKVVIDEAGAEALTGKGDGLIKSPEYMGVIRFQAFYKP